LISKNQKFNLSFLIRKTIELRGRFYLRYKFKNLENIAAIQRRVLFEKIKRNHFSDFGRDYHFEKIQSIPDFQKAIPLSEYDTFAPYIERVKRGDIKALFGPGEKLLMFALTSGTTGRAKYIPVTGSFLKEYKEGSKIWTSFLAAEFSKNPVSGKGLPIYSPIEEEKTSFGFSCGAISGLIAKSQGRLVRRLYAAPFEVSLYQNPADRLYAYLRAAAEHRVSIMVTANPSTLIQFAKTLEAKSHELIEDLKQGTFKGRLASFSLKQLPKKAEKLNKILTAKGKLEVRDVWPELQILACWKGGTLFHYVDKLPAFFGNVAVKDIGLLASEGRFSYPIFSDSDEGLLNIFHHFYEFISEDAEDFEKPRIYLAHELEAGKRYFMVITTSSGLYRYKLHDLIEVTRFYRKVPVIRFLNKGRHIASLTGEKLTEYQVTTCMHKIAAAHEVHIPFYRFFPLYDPSPHYALCVEKTRHPISETQKLIESFDSELQKINIEYASKRLSGRLAQPKFHWVKEGVFSDERKNSHRPEQFKPVYLDPDPEGYHKFKEAVIL